MICLIIVNFTQGFKILLDLTVLNIFKEVLSLEPAEVQLYMGIIAMPWSFKFIYSFMSDNIQLFNSRRRNHILINSFINIVSISLLMKYGLEQGKWFITAAIFLSQVNMAYCDTVTDALSAQASKHGIRDAHESLQYVEMIS